MQHAWQACKVAQRQHASVLASLLCDELASLASMVSLSVCSLELVIITCVNPHGSLVPSVRWGLRMHYGWRVPMRRFYSRLFPQVKEQGSRFQL